MRLKRILIALAFLTPACNLGPVIFGSGPTETPTPTATASEIPTLAPVSTDTPVVTPTFFLIPTVVPSPTALTCPKGTALNPSDNRCYFATRTPKPVDVYCPEYQNKSACQKHGCSWDAVKAECN